MINNSLKWEKLGRLIKPETSIHWMATFTGPSFAVYKEGSFYDVYVRVEIIKIDHLLVR